ncbi:Methylosome subunit pICln [Lamellibrachia satsuma]|nr:Methylosome subunit pICln [Lamellibrachia satsuma]
MRTANDVANERQMVILTSFPPPTEGIVRKQECTQAHVRGKCLGDGTLYIAESRVSWVGNEGEGFSLEYPAISLHAICRDLTAFPHECLYLMVDANIDLQEHRGDGDAGTSGDGDTDSVDDTSEIHFVPQDKGALTTMYQAMSDCQALHPDENDSFSEEEGQFYGADDDGEIELTESGRVVLQQLDAMLEDGGEMPQTAATTNGHSAAISMETEEAMETGQFEDAGPDD